MIILLPGMTRFQVGAMRMNRLDAERLLEVEESTLLVERRLLWQVDIATPHLVCAHL